VYRQQLKQDCRAGARDRCPCPVEDLALVALNISFDEMHALQTKPIERAYVYVMGLHAAKLGVRSLQTTGEVKYHPVVRQRHV
jgi:hypothetical protein